MKISVLIIAHNEEKYIQECLESVLRQTLNPDEIVLIAHNCTDQTERIAKKYTSIKTISYQGTPGHVYARLRGFESVSGDIIACLDGDSVAHKNWLKNLTGPFRKQHIVAVGGYVKLDGSLAARLTSWRFFFLNPRFNPKFHFYFWGGNFACRKNDYEKIGGFKPFLKIKPDLGLNYWADDAYLSLALEERGLVVRSSGAISCSPTDVKKESQWLKRGWLMDQDRKKLFKYFKIK